MTIKKLKIVEAICRPINIVFAIVAFVSLPAVAQNSKNTFMQRDSIYLYGTPKSGTPPEQWEGQGDQRIIRNVVSPVLIPDLYAKGGHAFALRQQGTTSDLWAEQFIAWMKTIGMLKSK